MLEAEIYPLMEKLVNKERIMASLYKHTTAVLSDYESTTQKMTESLLKSRNKQVPLELT